MFTIITVNTSVIIIGIIIIVLFVSLLLLLPAEAGMVVSVNREQM